MPAIEVIDLLSSPEVAVPARSKPKPKPPTARPKSRAPAKALDHDIHDMTAGDNIPWLSHPRAVPSKQSSKPCPKITSRDFSFLSDDDDDDFNATADLFDEAQPAKKPRIIGASSIRAVSSTGLSTKPTQRPASRSEKPAASTTTSASTSTVGWGPPRVLHAATVKRRTAAVEAIQTSSDPFASSPRKTAGNERKVVDLSLDDDVDPFASSPILPEVTEKQKGSKPPPTMCDSEHLFSSPYSIKNTAQPSVSLRIERANICGSLVSASSRMASPVKETAAKGKGKEPAAWDHISSSAPEAGPLSDSRALDMQPPRTRLARSRSDGAKKDFDLGDIDAFDSDSDDDGDDDELPDMSGIKSTKSRTIAGKSISRVTKRSTTFKPSSSKKTLAEKESEKNDKAIARDAEKNRKVREKEQRQADKVRATALAEVNKVKTDKKVSTPEMIVDLSTKMNPSLKLQIEELLKDMDVTFYHRETIVKNVVTWRRKVKARFNEDEGHWEPIPERIEKESHALVILQAAEFVEFALGAKGSDLEAHVLQMQHHYDGHTLLYLIEGLTPFMRKNANARNRQFNAAVQAALAATANNDDAAPPASTQQRKPRAPKAPAPHIDETLIEDALLSLQVTHNALVHHTNAPIETAEWVKVFTQHISTIPYRRQKDAVASNAAFCMDSGQVRTGDNARDTYVRMLKEIARLTEPMAYGIAGEFENVSELVRGLEENGALALEHIRKSANRDGAFTDRTVGRAMSRRVYKVFTGHDGHSMEI